MNIGYHDTNFMTWGGESALLELHTSHASGRMLHENWTLGKRLRGGGNIYFMRRAGKIGGGVVLIVEGGVK